MTSVSRIISGGQTGADRGGLLAAHDLGIARGGLASAGWRSEDFEIPQWFRTGMTQSGSESYRVRTRANVEASGGTLIVSFGPLPHDSGSMLTAKLARTLVKPCLHLWVWPDGHFHSVGGARLRTWLEAHAIVTLNVAGPRESREPGIQEATRAALVVVLGDDGFGWDPS